MRRKRLSTILLSAILSISMACSPIAGMTVWAAETTAEEAAVEEVLTAEEALAAEEVLTAEEVPVAEEETAVEEEAEPEGQAAEEAASADENDAMDEAVTDDNDSAENIQDQPEESEPEFLDEEQETASEDVAEESQDQNYIQSDETESRQEDSETAPENELTADQIRAFQEKTKIWKYDNQITIVYDSTEDVRLSYRLYSAKDGELLYEGTLHQIEENGLYYEAVDFDAVNEAENRETNKIDITDIPVKAVIEVAAEQDDENQDSNVYSIEEVVSDETGIVSMTEVDTETDGKITGKWDCTGGKEIDGYSVIVRLKEREDSVLVYDTDQLTDNEDDDAYTLDADHQITLNIDKESVSDIAVAAYKYDDETGVKQYGKAASGMIVEDESSDEEETVREYAAEGIADSGTCGENVTWTLDENGTMTVSGTGKMTDYDSNYNIYGRNTIVASVKSLVIEDGVTSIGNSAFSLFNKITSVSIPESVTSIGNDAFGMCSSLTSITIPNSVTSIGDGAFSTCSNLTSVIIPNSVASIGDSIFHSCSSLTNVSIPDSVTSIGNYAFCRCSSLTNVSIPDSVTSIGNDAFYLCSSLTSVTIPNSVTSIGSSAFCKCENLASVTISNNVTNIKSSAFSNCSSLTSVTIPESVTCIDYQAFNNCRSLKVITIPDSVKSIEMEAFAFCKNVTSATIGNGVKSIGSRAFVSCTNMTSVTIGDSVTSIGVQAFRSCTNLANVYYMGSASEWANISISEGNEPLTNANIVFTNGELKLDPEFTCNAGQTITVTATHMSSQNAAVTASVESDAGEALEFGEITVSEPQKVDSKYESIISFTLKGVETGEYSLTLKTSDGSSANTVIKVEEPFYFEYFDGQNYRLLGKKSVFYLSVESENPSADLKAEAAKATITVEDPQILTIESKYQAENYIEIRPKTLRPGKTNLIATFSDGTTFSKEIFIEPEMKVSVGAQYHNGEIEKTDQVISFCDVWCKVSLDGYDANKEYLEDFISNITYNEDEVKPIISVVENTTEVSEDGMTAWKKLRITRKNNAEDGRVKFVFKSAGQQAARSEEVTVKKDLLSKLSYRASGDVDKQHSYLFKDSYFYSGSEEYHNDLAVMSLGLELSAWTSHDYDSQYVNTVSDENGRNKNLINAFKTLGFKDPFFSKYDTPLSDSSNYAAFGIAKKTVSSLHDNDTLIAVAIRGGGYGAEWASNFDVGSSEDSLGFRNAADYILAELVAYINDLKESGEYSGNLKIWIVGFSRGAAIGNVLAHKINNRTLGIVINPQNLYAYTFATPNGQKGEDYSDKNIFNIVSSSDIVPRLPLNKGWGFSKYGTTNGIIGCFTNTYVKKTFKNYTGDTLIVSNAYENIGGLLCFLETLVPNRNEFVSMAQDSIMKSYKNGYANEEKGINIVLCLVKGIITSPALDGKLLAGPDFVNAWEKGDYLKAAVQVGKRTVGIVNDHFVGKTLSAVVDNLSLLSLMQSHSPEHYLAWLESGGIKEMGHDTYANLSDDERKAIAYAIGQQFEKRIAKSYYVYCPVNVTVYSSSGEVVGKIEDNKVVIDEIPCFVEGDTKIVYIPVGDDYHMELTGTDYGKMDYTVREYSEEYDLLRQVEFYDVDLSPERVYESDISDNTGDPNETYAVSDGTTTTVPSIDTEREIEPPLYTLTINGGETDYDQVMSGEEVSISAVVPENDSFAKWLSEDPEVYFDDPESENTTVRIPAKDTTITAHFASEHQWNDEYTVDVEPTQTGSGLESIHCAICDQIQDGSQIEIPSIEESVVVASGTCGDNLTWTLYNGGMLIIDGTGDMKSFGTNDPIHSSAPWIGYKEDIKKVILKKGVTKIGVSAFYGCANITSVSIPEGVTQILSNAFTTCTGLKNVSFPSSLERLEYFSFSGCKGLTSVTLPKNLTTITGTWGSNPFANCTSLKSIDVDPENPSFTSVDGVLFNKNMSGLYCYPGGKEVSHYFVPEGVVSIGGYAFLGCVNLTRVTMPDSLHRIGFNAFHGAELPASIAIMIPASVTYIEMQAFNDRNINILFGGTKEQWEEVVKERPIEYGSITYNYFSVDADFDLSDDSLTYTGEEIKPDVTVTYKGQQLAEDTDYALVYENNIEVGTASININGIGDYTGTAVKKFDIKPKDVSDLKISGISTKAYNGAVQTQEATVKDGEITLVNGNDYTVSYKNNINAGTASITITGKGNYTGSVTKTFTINRATQSITAKSSAATVSVGKTATVSTTGAKGNVTYSSSNVAVAAVDSKTGKVTAKKVGTVIITAQSAATANYNTASKAVTIKVVPAATASLSAANLSTGIKLKWKKVAGANGYIIYRNGSKIKTITSGSTVTYSDTKANTNGKKYTYKVVAKATTGTSTLSRSRIMYRVARTAVSSLASRSAGKITVKWKRNSKANGYIVQYSKSKSFSSGNKTATITKNTLINKTIGSLTKGKKYYVRVRCFKTVSGKKYYSAWSAAKAVTVKK